jgi:hypothetical protein
LILADAPELDGEQAAEGGVVREVQTGGAGRHGRGGSGEK